MHKLILKSKFSKASNGQEIIEKVIKGDWFYPVVTRVTELQESKLLLVPEEIWEHYWERSDFEHRHKPDRSLVFY